MLARSIETPDQDLHSEHGAAPTDPVLEAESNRVANDLFYPDELVYLTYDKESEIDLAERDPALLDTYLSGVPLTPIRTAVLLSFVIIRLPAESGS